MTSTYSLAATIYVNESEYNTEFYDNNGSAEQVENLVDGDVEDYYTHYIITYESIGTVNVTEGHSVEESDAAFEAYIKEKNEKAEKELEKKKDNAKDIRFKELDKNPDKYSGDFLKYQGEIIQIMEDETSTVIRLAVTKDSYGYDYNDVVYVTFDDTTPFVEEDIVTVYGTVSGSYTYESTAGHQITLPAMEAEVIE
ncbi:hypothetical protein M662_16500 [Bacillus sp. SB49]|uniref:hypothetical protein n=1 Tax=Bacillus sp. SB49 TaxID=1071080 RepID=UPI00138B1779|nr:hypothetical protein [Bacillus sp. SB49]QHT48013.1 hypothetical protein M662_16500 [Bacillus sp. SB49]